MSLHVEAADPESDLPSPNGGLQVRDTESLFTDLDGVIEHASRTRQLALNAHDENVSRALDDAISLLHHVRSRLRYDLGPTI